MARETLLQASFNAGVVSPRLAGRTDFAKYGSACYILSNCFGLVSGPAVFRPGSVFIGQSNSSATTSRLIPFKYNTTQAYMLEFANGKIRFFKNRGVILSSAVLVNGVFAASLAGWDNLSSGTGSATWSGGVAVLNGGAGGIGAVGQALTYIGVNTYTLTADVTVGALTVKIGTTQGATDIATGVLAIGVGSTFTFTPATDSATFYVQIQNAANSAATLDNVVLSTPEYAIKAPYLSADLPSISYAQDADVLYLAFPSDTVLPKTLQRYGHAQWSLQDMSFIDGPYLDVNTTTTTVTPSGVTGSVTLTASTAIFAATDVGRAFRWQQTTATNWGWGTITAYASPTSVTLSVQTTLGIAGASVQWRLGAFSATTGYPALVTFHEFRLVYGNTRTKPNFVWLSMSQGYGQNKALYAPSAISGTVADSNSIYFPLTAGDVSTIIWMSSGATLAIGTADSEWIVESGDVTKALSPTNTRATRRTDHGSMLNVRAVRIDGTVMFAQGTGHKVNKFVFNYVANKYDAVNLTQLAEHIFQAKSIVEMIYAPEPFSLMWCRMNDGTLNALTFVDSENVGGWSNHKLAGVNSFVESIAVIPSQDSSYSEVWMIVTRTINGSTKRYIEVMEQPFFLGAPKDACYVDCSLKYSGAPATVISGLSHLEGQTVSVLADGAMQTTKVVTGGSITLDVAASTVQAGLYYEGDVETLDFDSRNAFGGSSMGQIRRISDVQLRLHETGLVYTARAGQNNTELNLLEPRSSDDLMDTAPALKTGIFKVEMESEWGLSERIHVQFRSPMPGTLSAVMFKAMVNEA